MTNRPLFRRFAIAYIVVMLGGFLTYILYPAVPPWMAGSPLVQIGNQYVVPWKVPASFPGGVHAAWAQAHVYLPGVQNLFNVIMGHWYNPYAGTISFGKLLHIQYDPVGAIPSEHVADPILFFLFLRLQFGRWAYLSLLYIAGILFSITYMGQHYVIDAIIGTVYAASGYVLIMHVAPAVARRQRARSRLSLAPAASMRPDLEEVWIDD
jgi:membrane-associated phospholipid phosphatase